MYREQLEAYFQDKQDMLDNHRLLNDMIHQTDPTLSLIHI